MSQCSPKACPPLPAPPRSKRSSTPTRRERWPRMGAHYAKRMSWTDQRRRLRVRTNADTPADARRAREFGADGIGLCRTEHMFFEGDRITAMREMIVAPDEAGRRAALAKLLPM